MPIPKKTMMKANRSKRKDAGLVEYRVWVTPEERGKLKKSLERMRKASTTAEKIKPSI